MWSREMQLQMSYSVAAKTGLAAENEVLQRCSENADGFVYPYIYIYKKRKETPRDRVTHFSQPDLAQAHHWYCII